jgi:GAF domain-containing protein
VVAHQTGSLSHRIARQLDVDGCAISLLGRPVQASNRNAASLEDWQFVLGVGPAHAARAEGRVAHCSATCCDPWCEPFARQLHAAGVDTATAFPIIIGARRIGTLTTYQLQQHRMRVISRRRTARAVAEVGDAVFHDVEGWARRRDLVTGNFDLAAGYLACHQDIDITDAAAIIRASAYASDRALHVVCDAILAGHELRR